MKILTIANAKGGVGKTSIALGCALEKALGPWPWRVLCYDADSQRSLTSWADEVVGRGLPGVLREDVPADAPHGVVIVREFTGAQAVRADAAALGADLVIIDCKLIRTDDQAQLMRQQAALRMADVALVPVRASQLDLISQGEGIDLLAAAPGPALRYVLSAVRAPFVDAARSALEGLGCAVLAAVIHEGQDWNVFTMQACIEAPRRLRGRPGVEVRAVLREIGMATK